MATLSSFPTFSAGSTDAVFKQKQRWALWIPLEFGWSWQGLGGGGRSALVSRLAQQFPQCGPPWVPKGPAGQAAARWGGYSSHLPLLCGMSSLQAPGQSQGVQGHGRLGPSWWRMRGWEDEGVGSWQGDLGAGTPTGNAEPS